MESLRSLHGMLAEMGMFDRTPWQDENAMYREQAGREADLALRQLLHILRGGRPSRDPNFVPPPAPPGMLDPRGRARKQPPIIGVRG